MTTTPRQTSPPSENPHSLSRPGLTVFASSACILVLELVAERIIAPHVGVSLYTWTGIIGVVLAGMSAGNFVGGRLADRWASLRLLGAIFVLGGLSSLFILVADSWGVFATVGLPLIARILLVVVSLFFLPSALLGTVSPIVAKLAFRSLERTGRTVGTIYAAGTAGSIAGTLATGFVLVPWLDSHTILWSVGGVLVLLGIWFLARSRHQRSSANAETGSLSPATARD